MLFIHSFIHSFIHRLVAAALVIGMVSGMYIWTPILDNLQEQVNTAESSRRSAHQESWSKQPNLPTQTAGKGQP